MPFRVDGGKQGVGGYWLRVGNIIPFENTPVQCWLSLMMRGKPTHNRNKMEFSRKIACSNHTMSTMVGAKTMPLSLIKC